MAATTKFVVWIPTPTVGTNCQSQTAFSEEAQNGFASGQTASAIKVNTALRQANLVACALMEVLITGNQTLDVTSSVEDLATELTKHIVVNPNLVNGTGINALCQKGENVANGGQCGAFGYNNTITHWAAFALGDSLFSSAPYQLLAGHWNAANSSALLIVGNGTDVSHTSNAFVVLADGRAKVQTAPSDPEDVARKGDLPTPSSANPSDIADTGSSGSSANYSRADHTHAGVSSVTLNGTSHQGDVLGFYAPTSTPVGFSSRAILGWNHGAPGWANFGYYFQLLSVDLGAGSFADIGSITKGQNKTWNDFGGSDLYNDLNDFWEPDNYDTAVPVCCQNGNDYCFGWLSRTTTTVGSVETITFKLVVEQGLDSNKFQIVVQKTSEDVYTTTIIRQVNTGTFPTTVGAEVPVYQYYVTVSSTSPDTPYTVRGRQMAWEAY